MKYNISTTNLQGTRICVDIAVHNTLIFWNRFPTDVVFSYYYSYNVYNWIQSQKAALNKYKKNVYWPSIETSKKATAEKL